VRAITKPYHADVIAETDAMSLPSSSIRTNAPLDRKMGDKTTDGNN